MIGFAKLEATKGDHIITLDIVKLITSAMPIHNCKLKSIMAKEKSKQFCLLFLRILWLAHYGQRQPDYLPLISAPRSFVSVLITAPAHASISSEVRVLSFAPIASRTVTDFLPSGICLPLYSSTKETP